MAVFTLQRDYHMVRDAMDVANFVLESAGCSVLHEPSAHQRDLLVRCLSAYGDLFRVRKGTVFPTTIYDIVCMDVDSVNYGMTLATCWKEPEGFYWEE